MVRPRSRTRWVDHFLYVAGVIATMLLAIGASLSRLDPGAASLVAFLLVAFPLVSGIILSKAGPEAKAQWAVLPSICALVVGTALVATFLELQPLDPEWPLAWYLVGPLELVFLSYNPIAQALVRNDNFYFSTVTHPCSFTARSRRLYRPHNQSWFSFWLAVLTVIVSWAGMGVAASSLDDCSSDFTRFVWIAAHTSHVVAVAQLCWICISPERKQPQTLEQKMQKLDGLLEQADEAPPV